MNQAGHRNLFKQGPAVFKKASEGRDGDFQIHRHGLGVGKGHVHHAAEDRVPVFALHLGLADIAEGLPGDAVYFAVEHSGIPTNLFFDGFRYGICQGEETVSFQLFHEKVGGAAQGETVIKEEDFCHRHVCFLGGKSHGSHFTVHDILFVGHDTGIPWGRYF